MEQNAPPPVKVAILCTTYNHAPYILQSLEGFVIQKTDFPYAAIVIDDASTDKEPEVLWGFINTSLDASTIKKEETDNYIRIVARHKTNQNCIFVMIFLKYNHYQKKDKRPYYKDWETVAQYIAECEGDDYWTDPYKLQKQVDYLESHPECGLIYTDFDMFYQNNNCFENDLIKSGHYPQISSFEEHLQKAAYIAPPSWLYRRESKAYVENQMNKGFVDGSFSLALEFFKHSKVHFLEDTTCVYRVLPESASHHKSMLKQYIYAKGVYNEQIYFCHKYNVEKEISDAIKARFYRKYYGQTLSYGERKEKHELIEVSKSFMNEGLKNRLIRGLLSTKLSISLFSLVCRCKYRKD